MTTQEVQKYLPGRIELSDEALSEFREIWKRQHPGRQLPPDQELRDQAQRVLRAVELTYRPIPAEKVSLFNKL